MGLYQKVIRNVLFPLDRWRSGDASQLSYLREFDKSQFLSAEAIRELQLARVQRMVERAYRHCPYYRERFDQAGVIPSDIRTLADVAALPILQKKDIQENRDRMVSSDWPREEMIANQTGGSTGSPVSFFVSKDRFRSRAAATIRHNRWAGWDIGDKVALLWGAPRDLPLHRWQTRLRNLLLDRQLFLDTGHITEGRLIDFYHQLQRFRPKVILAYAGSIKLFARYLADRRLTPYQPRAIITSAEILEPADRKLIEDTFGCNIFNRYGCREVSVLASECEHHNGLHTMGEGLFIEIVKNDRPAPPGELGTILVTDLLNDAMPLIRYRMGDLGSWEEGACPCGRGLPRLRSVAGRVTEFLVGEDGRLVSGVFLATYVVAQRPSLGQVQMLQDRVGQVLYRILPGANFQPREDLAYLENTTKRYLGPNALVEAELVQEIKTEASGKHLFCRSKVAPEQLFSADRTAVGDAVRATSEL